MIGFQLTCGACGGAPLTPNDEGSAPELDVIDEAQGKWKLNLNDMGCPGIEAAWPAFDARPNDDMTWHDEWDELCERHYATWQLSVLDSGADAQTGTQSVSEPFTIVGALTARLDGDDEVVVEHVRISELRCSVCGVRVHHVVEAHWQGWLDDDDDQLSYVPQLHEHTVRAS